MTPAGQRLDGHLSAAIEEFSAREESEPTMRGMQRLANLTETVTKSIDAKADAVADRIVSGQARAEAAISKFGDLATSIEKTADDIEAALGQISNDPAQTSGGLPEPRL